LLILIIQKINSCNNVTLLYGGAIKIYNNQIYNMKLIKPKVELWVHKYDIDSIWNHVARCVRVCYQSEANKNSKENAKDFIERVILKDKNLKSKSNHLSVLEHGTVYITVSTKFKDYNNIKDFYSTNPYSKIVYKIFKTGYDKIETYCYVTTNLRVIIENDRLTDLYYISSLIEHHIKRYTFNIITNIGVSREMNRHRCHSISEESTRYCNYSKDKFGNELTFIIPAWINLEEGVVDAQDYHFYINNKHVPTVKSNDAFTLEWQWLVANNKAEQYYITLLNEGWKPQQAREVLPLSLKTQVVHTAFEDDWKDFIALRSDGISGAPHPNIKVIADKIKELLL